MPGAGRSDPVVSAGASRLCRPISAPQRPLAAPREGLAGLRPLSGLLSVNDMLVDS